MYTLNFRAMGCSMFAALDSNDPQAEQALAAVPLWFEEWEQQLSRFRPGSDLNQLNTSGQALNVPDALWEVVGLALRAARESEGLVQPTLLEALEAAGYDRTFDDIRGQGSGVRTQGSGKPGHTHAASGSWKEIRLDPKYHSISLPRGLRLDLGGVAKGWAAEQAANRLAAHGPALIDAGGDVAVNGPMADGSAWPIGIANPLVADEVLDTLLLVRGAVATSGRDYRRWRQGNTEQHHIIDPRTGQPASTDILTATVVASDGPTAEIAAKSALILGSRQGLAWLDARPYLAGLLILEDGQVLQSRRIHVYLESSQ